MLSLTALLKSSSARPSPLRTTSSTSASASPSVLPPPLPTSPPPPLRDNSPIYLLSHDDLPLPSPEPPDLRDLNNSLAALAAVFPDVQIEVFREMLTSFTDESRLAVVADTLLRHKRKWARGRYVIPGGAQQQKTLADDDDGNTREGSIVPVEVTVPVEERFRSLGYKKAVKAITYHEFKGLPRSTINAVLAEQNYSYGFARPHLIALSAKSWRFSISSFFSRRSRVSTSEAENHPLVTWQSAGQAARVPSLKSTGCAELDGELFEALVLPLQKQAKRKREEKDHALALEINNAEAEIFEALHDCECCFTATSFEELSACNDGGHFICYLCVQRSVNESIFGQGWSRNIELHSGSLRCLAPMADDCQGYIPRELVNRAIQEGKNGDDILRKLDERLIEDSLLKTNLSLIRCPFCSYAEVDELYLPNSQQPWHFKPSARLYFLAPLISLASIIALPFMLPLFFLLAFLSYLLLPAAFPSLPATIKSHLLASLTRLRRQRRGQKFTCRNPTCLRPSCLTCFKPWIDIHTCHESSLQALRTHVELAMSAAIKRTCPRCNVSFVKSEGCNKLTCVCGYQMCYVCRKDIGSKGGNTGEGYKHFCEHFRPDAGRGANGRRCAECRKCDLYRCEDEEMVLRKAKEEAERMWVEKEGEGGEEVRRMLEAGGKKGWDWEGLLDWVVDGLVE